MLRVGRVCLNVCVTIDVGNRIKAIAQNVKITSFAKRHCFPVAPSKCMQMLDICISLLL